MSPDTSRRRRRFRPLPLIGLLLLLAGCGNGGSSTATTTDAAGCVVVSAPTAASRSEPRPTAPLAADKKYDVTFKTNCGSFTIGLDQAQSPHATASFVSLVKAGYFDHTIFHRISLDFVIQGGDPTASGSGGPGYQTVDAPPARADYSRYTVAMAKTGAEPPGTAGSQFFVVTTLDAGLPPDYAIIGAVTKGFDVVDRIGKLGASNEQPTEVVEIEQATVADS